MRNFLRQKAIDCGLIFLDFFWVQFWHFLNTESNMQFKVLIRFNRFFSVKLSTVLSFSEFAFIDWVNNLCQSLCFVNCWLECPQSPLDGEYIKFCKKAFCSVKRLFGLLFTLGSVKRLFYRLFTLGFVKRRFGLLFT